MYCSLSTALSQLGTAGANPFPHRLLTLSVWVSGGTTKVAHLLLLTNRANENGMWDPFVSVAQDFARRLWMLQPDFQVEQLHDISSDYAVGTRDFEYEPLSMPSF